APAHAWICVSNERSGDMTLLDAETRSTVATIPLGQRPRGIHASPDGRFLYVALSGSPIGGPGADGARAAAADRDADGIGVVDLARRKVVRILHAGVDPEEIAIIRDGSRLVVSNEDAGTASIVRARDGAIEHVVPV